VTIANQSYNRHSDPKGLRNLSNLSSNNLLRSSITANKLYRQFPMIAAFHRAVDGALIGLLVIVVVMSAVSLHAQHLWTVSFSRLETSRSLIHKLKESISILESHFLASKSIPEYIDKTKPSDLLYLKAPRSNRHLRTDNSSDLSVLDRFVFYPINHGY